MQKKSINLSDDIWPNERDLIERPDRIKYVRKLIKTKSCVFCSRLKDGISSETLLLYKNNSSMVFMNKYPYNTGHLLIMPQEHIGDIESLSDVEYQDFFELIRKSYIIAKKVFDPQGVNMGMNLGKASGAGIPDHIHYHIVPRWNGDTNFFPVISETKVLIESLKDSYDKLKIEFDKLKDGRG